MRGYGVVLEVRSVLWVGWWELGEVGCLGQVMGVVVVVARVVVTLGVVGRAGGEEEEEGKGEGKEAGKGVGLREEAGRGSLLVLGEEGRGRVWGLEGEEAAGVVKGWVVGGKEGW